MYVDKFTPCRNNLGQQKVCTKIGCLSNFLPLHACANLQQKTINAFYHNVHAKNIFEHNMQAIYSCIYKYQYQMRPTVVPIQHVAHVNLHSVATTRSDDNHQYVTRYSCLLCFITGNNLM